jgi:hypothetical protein
MPSAVANPVDIITFHVSSLCCNPYKKRIHIKMTNDERLLAAITLVVEVQLSLSSEILKIEVCIKVQNTKCTDITSR